MKLIDILLLFGNIIPPILYVLVFTICSFGYGSFLLQWFDTTNRRVDYFIYSIALGFGILGHVTLIIGSFGLLYRSSGLLILFLGLVFGVFEIVKNRAKYHSTLIQILKFPKISWFSGLMIVLLFINFIYPLFTNALVPPYNYDSVAYHLAVPKIYLQNHTISYISFIPYSNWPLETEMLYALSLLLSSEAGAQLITWVCLILVSLSFLFFGRKWFNEEVGLLAAVIFTSTPMVTTLAGTALIELPLTLYTFLAVMTFLEWLISDKPSYWILSAIFGGLAASTKLNGAILPLILGSLLLFVLLKRRQTKSLTYFIYYGLIAFVIVSPWYIKTWIQTGNPFWPFLFNLFGGRNWDELGTEYLLGFIRLPNIPLTVKNWIIGVYLLTFQAVKFGPYRVFLGPLYILLLPLSIPAFFKLDQKRRQFLGWLLVLGFIFYCVWFLQTHQTRFLMPATSIFALISAIGLYWLWNLGSRWWSIFVKVVIICLLVLISWITNPADRTLVRKSWPFLSGQMTRDQFLERVVQGYDVFSFANDNLSPDAYIWMALYESRGYFVDHEYMWANPISQREIRLEEFLDSGDLAEELRNRGFTHIIYWTDQMESFSYIKYGPDLIELSRDLISGHAKLIYQSAPLELYELNH